MKKCLSAASLLGVLLLTGCGSTNAPTDLTQPNQVVRSFAYAAPTNNLLNLLNFFTIDTSTGTPTQGPNIPLSAGAVGSITASRDGKFVFVTRSATRFSVLSVNPQTGALTTVVDNAAGSFPSPNSELVINGRGNLLCNPAGGTVGSFRVTDQGGIDPVATSATLPGGSNAFDGVVDSTGQFGYFIDASNIYRCTINQSTGALTFATTTNSPGAGFTDICINDGNQFLFLLDDTADVIRAFSLNADGSLNTLGTLALPAGTYSHIATSGSLVAVSEFNTGITTPLLIQSNGSLVAAPGTGNIGGTALDFVPFLPILITGNNNASNTNVGTLLVQSNGSLLQPSGSPINTAAGEFVRDFAAVTTVSNQ